MTYLFRPTPASQAAKARCLSYPALFSPQIGQNSGAGKSAQGFFHRMKSAEQSALREFPRFGGTGVHAFANKITILCRAFQMPVLLFSMIDMKIKLLPISGIPAKNVFGYINSSIRPERTFCSSFSEARRSCSSSFSSFSEISFSPSFLV